MTKVDLMVNSVQKISKNNHMGTEEFWQLYMQDFDYNYIKLLNADKKNQAMALEDKKDLDQYFCE